MKTIDFNEMGVRELRMSDLVKTDGGVTIPMSKTLVTTVVSFVKWCLSSGGEAVN